MARAMFKYRITILEKVSFSVDLFCKEFKKAIDSLLPHEVDELLRWANIYTSDKPQLRVCLVQA